MQKIMELSFVNSDNVKVWVLAFKEPNNYMRLHLDINGTVIINMLPDIPFNEKAILKVAKKIEKESRSQYKMFDFCVKNGIYDNAFSNNRGL